MSVFVLVLVLEVVCAVSFVLVVFGFTLSDFPPAKLPSCLLTRDSPISDSIGKKYT